MKIMTVEEFIKKAVAPRSEHFLYQVFYTEEIENTRETDMVFGFENAINYAIMLAKTDGISYVTIHETNTCNTGIFKGVVSSRKLICTIDSNDKHSIALAKEKNVPCINISK